MEDWGSNLVPVYVSRGSLTPQAIISPLSGRGAGGEGAARDTHVGTLGHKPPYFGKTGLKALIFGYRESGESNANLPVTPHDQPELRRFYARNVAGTGDLRGSGV